LNITSFIVGFKTVHFKTLSKFNMSLELDLCSNCQNAQPTVDF